jgi:CheY-like chemotaxis protein
VSPYTVVPLPALAGRRVLVVEDEPFFALRLETILGKLGCTVLGPAHRLADALTWTRQALDVALLDINLAGTPVFPVADALAASGVPFIFVTAYDRSALPAAYQGAALVTKPLSGPDLTRALVAAVTPEGHEGSGPGGALEARRLSGTSTCAPRRYEIFGE